MSARAEKLLRESIVVNQHDDLLSDVLYRQIAGEKDVIATRYLPEFRKAHLDVVVAALFIDDLFVNTAFENACSQVGALLKEADKSDEFVLAKDLKDIMKAKEKGKVAIMLSLEGLEPIGSNPRLLRVFYELGVRFVGPTWARRNMCCDGTVLTDFEDDSNGGFTTFGLEVLDECESLGMIMDASHISDTGFWQMAKRFHGKIYASHSNSRSVYDISRNIPDEQVLEIARRGGVIGLNAVNTLLSDSDETSNFAKLVENALYFKKIAGVQHVGFGFDFFETISMYVPFKKQRRPIKDVIRGYGDVVNFVEALLEAGFSEAEVTGIVGGNFIRMLGE